MRRLGRARANALCDYNRRLAKNTAALATDFRLWPWLDSLLLDGYPATWPRSKLLPLVIDLYPGNTFKGWGRI